ncbi:MAG: ribonucleoside-triphosphate reductase [Thermoleophilia bacterium]|nr:ribonucleoside-triphosphate reductase [Thermoleophilia bacterium]
MSLTDDLAAASAALPVRLDPQKDGSLKGEAVVAERKAFLSKKKLTYKCKARVDDASRTVRFWEMLMEKGSGVSSGPDDFGPGVGFKAGTYKTGGKERSGSIEEASSYLAKDYSCRSDCAAVRTELQQVAASAGYGWDTLLNPKSV